MGTRNRIKGGYRKTAYRVRCHAANGRIHARSARYWARHPVVLVRHSRTSRRVQKFAGDKARNARYIARHPVKMVRYSATSTRWHNWRNGAAIERGRAPRLDGAIAAATSRAPVVRNRVNPATGRKHRDDAMMHRTRNEGLARMKDRTASAERIREHHRTRDQAFRAGDIGAANEAHERWYRAYTSAPPAVRERYGSLVSARQPQGRQSRTRRLGRRPR
jgi:hypothetical protein